MSKKDRVLISILATMMLNTSTFSLFAAADNTTNINNTAESGNVLNETAPSEDAASEIQQDASEQTSESDPQEKTDVTEITEHSWGSWETEKESTITEAGIRIHTCTKCGKVERAAMPKQSLRICGSNRFNTAFEAAKQIMKENGGKKFDSIVIACGSDFADALSASYLSKVTDSPILLYGKAVEKQMIDFLKENANSSASIYIVGGTGPVSEDFEKSLKKEFTGKDQVKRLFGANRFGTNYEVLKEAQKFEKNSDGEVLVASGINYADALSASAVGKPVLLVAGKKLTDDQKAYLEAFKGKAATVIGGEGAVSKEIEKELKGYVSKTERLSGSNRFETSYLVAHKYFSKPSTIVLSYGLNYPDGLSGGPLALRYGSPLLLVANSQTQFANKFAAETAVNGDDMVSGTVTLGGETLISDDALKSIITDELTASGLTSQTVKAAITISGQPSDWSGKPGETADLEIKAEGKDLKYQWQSSIDGMSWNDLEGKTSAALTVSAALSLNGTMYRCVVTSACGETVISDAAKLTCATLSVLEQPQSWSAAPDSDAFFYAQGSKDGLDYTWQYSTDNGKTWKNTTVKTPEYKVRITKTTSNRLVRCKMTDKTTGETITTNPVKLSECKDFKVVKQPAQPKGEIGSVQKIAAQVGGEGLTFQWQVSNNGTSGWKNVTGSSANKACLDQKVIPSECGKYFRCVVKDKNGKTITTKAVQLVSNETGFVEYAGKKYYMNSDHTPAKGIQKVGNDSYYFSNTGEMQTGLRKVNYVLYLFDPESGKMKTGVNKVDSKVYCFGTDGKAVSGWHTEKNGEKYYFSPSTNAAFKGFKTIDSKQYYFNSDGVKTTGVILDTAKGKYRYIEDTPVKNAFVKFNGGKYYIDKNGYAVTGLNKISGNMYYFGKNAAMMTGGYLIDGKRYFFDVETGKAITGIKERENGKKYYYNGANGVGTGLKKVNGDLYFFDNDGTMKSGQREVNGKWYYFDNQTGKAVNGWRENIVSSGNVYMYYYSPTDHAAVTGLQKIDNDYYFFSENGNAMSGRQLVNNTVVYFDPTNFKLYTGYVKIGEKVYYSDGLNGLKYEKNAEAPAKAKSWGTYDGAKCYYGLNGKRLTGLQIIDKKFYLFDKNGKMLTGLQEHGGVLRCYTENGILLGMQTVNGKLYYFDSYGAALKSQVKIIKEKTYYFTADGSAATGFCYVPEYLCTFYFDEDHTAHTGWLELNGKKYYFNSYYENDYYPAGTPAHGITYIGNQTAYFDYETAQQKTGLIKIAMNKYMYFDPKTGYAVSGLKEINGSLYYFSDDKKSFGSSVNGFVTIGNDTYYFASDTQKAVTGFVTSGQSTYYFGSDHKQVKGMQKIGNDLYCFHDKKGYMRTGLFQINGKYYCFNDEGKAISGWYTTDNGEKLYFSEKDHTAYTGMQIIDGEKYFFTDIGILKTGLIKDSSGKYHYLVNEGQSTGFIDYNGYTYYIDDLGNALTGLQKINGSYYYFLENGRMVTGAYTINGKYCYFGDDGKAVTGFVKRENGYSFYYNGVAGAKTGLQKIDGKLYYLSSYGAVLSGRYTIGNKIYFFDPQTGVAQSGWKEYVTSIGDAYISYYSPDDYAAVTGLKKIDGAYYYFSERGNALAGAQKVNNITVYFDPNTFKLYTGYVMINNKVFYSNGLKGLTYNKTAKAPAKANTWGTISGSKCYYGQNGKVLTGAQVIGKKLYMFDDSGKMMTGFIKHNGVTRYYTENGILTGLQKIGSSYYYFSPADGSMLTGLRSVSDVKYYFDEKGRRVEGWISYDGVHKCYISHDKVILTGLQTIDGKNYWFGNSGIMRTGVQNVSDGKGNSRICLFDDDGAMVLGLVERFGNLYYYDETTGEKATGWKTINGKTYYFSPAGGAAYKGKKRINNYNYYFDTDTAEKKTGLIWYKDRLYRFDEKTKDGLTYGLTKIDGELYYFNENNGAAKTGFLNLDDVYYYFSEETGKSIEGIRWVNNVAFYFEKTGGVRKGLVTYEGKQYYCYPSSGNVITGLISVGNKLYCFDDSGAMMTNTTVVIGGITYTIDDSGIVSVEGNSKLENLIRSGIEKLGTAYVPGSNLNDYIDPSNGTNCSRFIGRLLSEVGIDSVFSIYQQYHELTHSGNYDVELVDSISDLKPGDLIYEITLNCPDGRDCRYWDHMHHVMLYLGEGKVLQSTDSKITERKGVVIDDIINTDSVFISKIVRLRSL